MNKRDYTLKWFMKDYGITKEPARIDQPAVAS